LTKIIALNRVWIHFLNELDKGIKGTNIFFHI
jgi:hypothetical protein